MLIARDQLRVLWRGVFVYFGASSPSPRFLTANALVGDFGGEVRIWGERLLAATALVGDFCGEVEICDKRNGFRGKRQQVVAKMSDG